MTWKAIMAPAAIAILGVLSTQAAAATWRRISASNAVTGVYVDDSEAGLVGDYQGRWVKIDYRYDKSEKARSGVFRFYLNCRDRTLGIGSYVKYRADGSVLTTWDGSPAYTMAIPDSIGEMVLQDICSKRPTPDDTIQLLKR